jgi:hypothetical protein
MGGARRRSSLTTHRGSRSPRSWMSMITPGGSWLQLCADVGESALFLVELRCPDHDGDSREILTSDRRKLIVIVGSPGHMESLGAQYHVGDQSQVLLGVDRRHTDDDVAGAGIDVACDTGGDVSGRADDECLDG